MSQQMFPSIDGEIGCLSTVCQDKKSGIWSAAVNYDIYHNKAQLPFHQDPARYHEYQNR